MRGKSYVRPPTDRAECTENPLSCDVVTDCAVIYTRRMMSEYFLTGYVDEPDPPEPEFVEFPESEEPEPPWPFEEETEYARRRPGRAIQPAQSEPEGDAA